MLVASVISVAAPFLARTNVWLLFASRIIMGLAQVRNMVAGMQVVCYVQGTFLGVHMSLNEILLLP